MTNDLSLDTRILLSMQQAGHAMMKPSRFAKLFTEGFTGELSYAERCHIIQLYSASYARLKARNEERELEQLIKESTEYTDVVRNVNQLLGFYL